MRKNSKATVSSWGLRKNVIHPHKRGADENLQIKETDIINNIIWILSSLIVKIIFLFIISPFLIISHNNIFHALRLTIVLISKTNQIDDKIYT